MSSDAGHRLVGVVYVNNDPPPTARILGDLKADVSARFSIAPDHIRVLDEDGNVLKDDIEIMKAPPKFRVEIRQVGRCACTIQACILAAICAPHEHCYRCLVLADQPRHRRLRDGAQVLALTLKNGLSHEFDH